jgi:hypothetical protein
VLHLLFAVAQFLCLAGLLCGLLAVLLSGHRKSSASRRNSLTENADERGRPLATVQLAVLPEKPVALIKVVPLESSPLLSGPNAPAAAKDAREQQKPARRRLTREAINRAGNEERAALLMKHARKRPGSDRPRVL